MILTATGGEARLWDAKTCQPLTQPVMHNAPVEVAQFIPGSNRVITAAETGVKLWEPRDGKFVETSRYLTPSLLHVAVSADGDLVAGSVPLHGQGSEANVLVYDWRPERNCSRCATRASRNTCGSTLTRPAFWWSSIWGPKPVSAIDAFICGM